MSPGVRLATAEEQNVADYFPELMGAKRLTDIVCLFRNKHGQVHITIDLHTIYKSPKEIK